MQVLKYNIARRNDAVWGRKALRLPMAIGIGPQTAHLSRFIGIVGPRYIIFQIWLRASALHLGHLRPNAAPGSFC